MTGEMNRSLPMNLLPVIGIALLLAPWLSSPVYAQDGEGASSGKETEPRTIPRGPLEVPARIEADKAPKEVTFDFPAVDRFVQPLYDWGADVYERHGLKLGFDYQTVSQWSDNDFGSEDSATGGIFRGRASWEMWARDNPARTGSLDFQIEQRHKINSDIPPEALAPNFGWLGTTAPDWSDQEWGITNLMLRQRLDVGEAPIELRVGYIAPLPNSISRRTPTT